MSARLSLRDLTKRYGDVDAVRGLSLDVAGGELVVLLGPSGSGKSTVLKMIAGIEPVDEGEIWIGDRRVDLLLPRYRDVAMVFQSYALYPHLSVFANLAFPLRSTGAGRQDVRRRVREVAAMLELDGLLDRRPGQLSGGQQQRVALGRAIVRRPAVFLLDEPLSNLDAKLRAQTRAELTSLHQRVGTTTVYVTHDQVEALTMGDRVAVVDEGQLRQIDRPETVYDQPDDVVVAAFLGSPPMNLIRCRCEPCGEVLRFASQDIDMALCLPALAASAGLPAEVVLGVRAEHVRLSEERCDALRGAVEHVELLGSERVVWLRIGTDRVAVRVPAAVRPTVGERISVAIDPCGVRLFDASTGRRLGT